MKRYKLKGAVAFTARVRASKRGLSVSIPPAVALKLGLKEGAYVLLVARRAAWYSLLEWDGESLKKLPPEAQDEVRAVEALRKSKKLYVCVESRQRKKRALRRQRKLSEGEVKNGE